MENQDTNENLAGKSVDSIDWLSVGWEIASRLHIAEHLGYHDCDPHWLSDEGAANRICEIIIQTIQDNGKHSHD